MFTRLDRELFGSPCEVYQLESSQGFVFPIFKNGSSTLKQLPHKTLINQQLADCKDITIYLRDPTERFVSGVHTYVGSLDKSLDRKTVMHFVKNFPFLNRHYMPQYFWLAQLATYTHWFCTFNLRPLSELSDLTDSHVNHTSNSIDEEFKRDVLTTVDLDSYLQLDQRLMDNVGKRIHWSTLVADYKNTDTLHYYSIFGIQDRFKRVLP